eukprot:1283999-Amphidinium_carterae.1
MFHEGHAILQANTHAYWSYTFGSRGQTITRQSSLQHFKQGNLRQAPIVTKPLPRVLFCARHLKEESQKQYSSGVYYFRHR